MLFLLDLVGSVTKSDVRDVARSMVISYPAVVAAPVLRESRASYFAVTRSDVSEGQVNLTPSGSSF